ncbi:hypothetical protein JYJ95_28820 [Corallococcus exiguus]|uniref:hypothetical protein n=1 Tax=Corallococcus exiguus TaxID=83462 RepID=UPI001A8CB800|nr:hypothetical protein [Corallococcus exiguus]MBN8470530.1 hypothetical protein [Corallococcus exiguus]
MPLDLEAFQKTRVYQRRATVAEVLEDLQALAPQPQRAPEVKPAPARSERDGMRRLGQGLLLATGVCIGALWLLPLDQRSGFFGLLLMLSFFMGLGGAMVFIASWLGAGFDSPMGASFWPAARSVDPDKEQRRLLLATLLQRFRLDLLDAGPVEVTLDLSSPLAPGKSVHEGKHGEDFADPWLSLQGRLADGTHLSVAMVDEMRMLKRTKITPRKVKHQSKRTESSLIQVALRVKPERHPGLADMEDRVRGAVQLPPGATLKQLRVAEDRMELRVLLKEGWVAQALAPEPSDLLPGKAQKASARRPDASHTVTMMLSSLHQVLGATRQQPV